MVSVCWVGLVFNSDGFAFVVVLTCLVASFVVLPLKLFWRGLPIARFPGWLCLLCFVFWFCLGGSWFVVLGLRAGFCGFVILCLRVCFATGSVWC